MKNHVFEFSLQKTQEKTNEVLQVTDKMTREVTKEIVHRQMNNIQNDAPYRKQFIKNLIELSIKFKNLQQVHSKFFSKLLLNLNKTGSSTSRRADYWHYDSYSFEHLTSNIDDIAHQLTLIGKEKKVARSCYHIDNLNDHLKKCMIYLGEEQAMIMGYQLEFERIITEKINQSTSQSTKETKISLNHDHTTKHDEEKQINNPGCRPSCAIM
jgi:hypothetical protein